MFFEQGRECPNVVPKKGQETVKKIKESLHKKIFD